MYDAQHIAMSTRWVQALQSGEGQKVLPWHVQCSDVKRVTEWGGDDKVDIAPIVGEAGLTYQVKHSGVRPLRAGEEGGRYNREVFFERRIYTARFRQVTRPISYPNPSLNHNPNPDPNLNQSLH